MLRICRACFSVEALTGLVIAISISIKKIIAKMKKIISLTSIPPRFKGLKSVLNSLASNMVDEIRLYIPLKYHRFPDWDGLLPETPRSVKIFRCPVDYGPATKVLPACKDLRGQEVQIFFCDDDLICKPGWIDNLFYSKVNVGIKR